MLILLANQSAAGALMTEVATWSTTDDSNVDIFPEGMYLGQVNNAGRAMQGAIKRWQQGAGDKYIAPVGSVGAPTYTFLGDTDTGFWNPTTGVVAVSINGAEAARWNASNQLVGVNGSAALPTYTFTGSTTTGWYRAAADEPALSVAGSEALRLSSTERMLFGHAAGFSTSGGKFQVTFAGAGAEYGISLKAAQAGSTTFLDFLNESETGIGSVTRSGGTVVYNTTSDARLKDVLGPVEPGNAIDAIEPVRFTWKEHPAGPARLGFIAQDLHEVAPYAVTVGDDEKRRPWMVDVSALIPVVIAELKALRKRVSTLEKRADQNLDTPPAERIII
jgi:hypothetical protein